MTAPAAVAASPKDGPARRLQRHRLLPRVRMRWRDAAFLHWRLPAEEIQAWLPRGLEADTHAGAAWVSAVPFWMERTRLLGLPLAPRFPELNLRTYVRHRTGPGIWFLAIDATGPFVPLGRMQGMPYRRARIRLEEGAVESEPHAGPAFSADWQTVEGSASGDLDRFLVERYVAFGQRRGRLVASRVAHPPWPLRPAVAQVRAWGSLPSVLHGRHPDLAHVSPGVDVAAAPALRVAG